MHAFKTRPYSSYCRNYLLKAVCHLLCHVGWRWRPKSLGADPDCLAGRVQKFSGCEGKTNTLCRMRPNIICVLLRWMNGLIHVKIFASVIKKSPLKHQKQLTVFFSHLFTVLNNKIVYYIHHLVRSGRVTVWSQQVRALFCHLLLSMISQTVFQ